MAECQLPKLNMRVRFPSLALIFNSGVDKMRNDVITKGGSDKPEQDGKNMRIDEDVIFDCECDFDVFDDVVDDVVCEDD